MEKYNVQDNSDIESKCCFSLILSICAFAFSLLLMFPCLPRILSSKEIQFDYIGAIIGVLSILVTILLGWNIYTVIDFKSKIKKAQHDYKKLEGKIIETDQKAFDANISTNYVLYQFYDKNKEYPGAVTSLIIALANMIEIDLAENNKAGNIQRFSEYLKSSYTSMVEEKQQFGENNTKIIAKNINEIRSNKDYHYIENLFKDVFENIESSINTERK